MNLDTVTPRYVLLPLLICSILYISCSKDSDLFKYTIEEQLVEEPVSEEENSELNANDVENTNNTSNESSNDNNDDTNNTSNESSNDNDDESDTSKSGEMIVDEGFESGSSAWGSSGTFRAEKNDASIVGNAREGDKAVRFTAAAGGERSEFAIRRGDNSNYYYEWGVEYWHAVSIKVVRPVGGYRIALQHHAIPEDNPNRWTNSAGSNSFTLTMTESHLTFWTSTNSEAVTKSPGSSSALGQQVGHSAPYNKNEWIDIVSHFRLAADNTGFYEIWMNGQKIVDIHNNPTVYIYDNGGGEKYPYDYSKIGIYYGNKNKVGEVHYDSFKILRGSGSYDMMIPKS